MSSCFQLTLFLQERLLQLNSLVWPEVRKEVERRCESSKKRVVCEWFLISQRAIVTLVVEAAAMIEAGWDTSMNEVWTVFIPKEEAIRRIQERNDLSKEDVCFVNAIRATTFRRKLGLIASLVIRNASRKVMWYFFHYGKKQSPEVKWIKHYEN